MDKTHIIRNGDPDKDEVVFSALLRWGAKVGTGVAIVVLAAAVMGGATFLRKVDKTIDAMEALTSKVDLLTTQMIRFREDDQKDKAALALTQEQLKARLSALDRR